MFRSKSSYQNLKNFNEITEKRLQLDTEFLKLGKELETQNKEKEMMEKKEILQTPFSKEQLDDSQEDEKEFILYIDEKEKSLECLLELKKNVDFKLQCHIIKKESLNKVPSWVTSFPYLVDKKTKKGYELNKCLEIIKTKKFCKMSYKKNSKNFSWSCN